MIITWGNRIFILYMTFALGMITLVYKCCQVNYDLVSKDYYNEELAYQQLIDGSLRSAESAGTIRMSQVDKGVLINFENFSGLQGVEGDCHFYFAPDAANDFKIKLKADADSTQFVRHDFYPGTYIVKLRWNASGQFHYQEKKLLIR